MLPFSCFVNAAFQSLFQLCAPNLPKLHKGHRCYKIAAAERDLWPIENNLNKCGTLNGFIVLYPSRKSRILKILDQYQSIYEYALRKEA